MEKLIDDAKLNELLASRMGPTVTKDSIEAQISGETFLRPEGTTLTICVLTLANGFTVTGVSACADPANFDEDIGRKLARDNAFNKIWELEGYLLKERIHRSAQIADEVAQEAADAPRVVQLTPEDADALHALLLELIEPSEPIDQAVIVSLSATLNTAIEASLA